MFFKLKVLSLRSCCSSHNNIDNKSGSKESSCRLIYVFWPNIVFANHRCTYFPHPLSQTTLLLLWGFKWVTKFEFDREWLCLHAVTDLLLLAQELLDLSYLSQAVIQNPFTNGGSPAGETVGGETRFAYFPATAVSDGTVSVQAASDPPLTQAGQTLFSCFTRVKHWHEIKSVVFSSAKQECAEYFSHFCQQLLKKSQCSFGLCVEKQCVKAKMFLLTLQ